MSIKQDEILSQQEIDRVVTMRSHLKNAVTSNHENYRAIVNQMRAQLAAGDLDESSRAIWFSCVNGLIDVFGDRSSELFEICLLLADFHFPSLRVAKLTASFFINIMSSCGNFIGHIYKKAVSSLQANANTTIDDMIVDPVTLVGHRRVLEFLSKALLVVPSSQHQFLEIVSRELITDTLSLNSLKCMIISLSVLGKSNAKLRDALLVIFVKAMLPVDAEIRLEDDDDSDVDQPAVIRHEELFCIGGSSDDDDDRPGYDEDHDHDQGDDDHSGPILGDDDGPNVPFQAKNDSARNEMLITKLDFFMGATLDYIRDIAKVSPDICNEVYSVLLVTFERNLLPTYQSKYVQFLVFYASSFHPDYPQYFLGFCSFKMRAKDQGLPLRLASIAYMASYMARSRFLSDEVLRSFVEDIAEFIHSYLDEKAHIALPPKKPQDHTLLYTAIQGFNLVIITVGLCYVICFKYPQIFESDAVAAFSALGIGRILNSKFLPLHIISESVASEFISCLNKFSIPDGENVWKETKEQGRDLKRHIVMTIGSVAASKMVASFFPFDPYHLPESGDQITPIYYDWVADNESEESGSLPGSFISPSFGNSLNSHSMSLEESFRDLNLTKRPPSQNTPFSPSSFSRSPMRSNRPPSQPHVTETGFNLA